ncbi:hypothetical protein [Streptomyces sp. A0642]|uniref:hypothetical protein n=1 Tax=Streptomyces sp. A0642 TaxID=2563100 RepID=UPI001F0E1313|nr:hypothetical protein [Streptomyces sp. A0642]
MPAVLRWYYSGKHKCHGLLVIALTDDEGRPAWGGASRTASEITARYDHLTAHLRAAGSARSPTWASSAWTTAVRTATRR